MAIRIWDFFVSLPTLQTFGHTDKHLNFQAFLPRTYHKELLQTEWFEMFVDAKKRERIIRTAEVVQVRDFIHAGRGPHCWHFILTVPLNGTLSSGSVLPALMPKIF
jgi:hypothetical protein